MVDEENGFCNSASSLGIMIIQLIIDYMRGLISEETFTNRWIAAAESIIKVVKRSQSKDKTLGIDLIKYFEEGDCDEPSDD